MFNWQGFLLLLLLFVITGISAFLANWNKNKLRNNYFVWALINIAIFVYFLYYRFLNNFLNFSQANLAFDNTIKNYSQSILFSKAFLLDMCPFLAFCLPLSFLIYDKKQTIAMCFSPFSVVGSLITLSTIVLENSPGGHAAISITYIFLGYKGNELYFIIHAYNLVLGIVLLTRWNFTKIWNVVYFHIFPILYFSYVAIFVYAFGVSNNVTGLARNDWVGGQYDIVRQIFKLDYPWILIVSFSLVYIVIFIMITTLSFLTNIKFKKQKTKQKINHVRFIIQNKQ